MEGLIDRAYALTDKMTACNRIFYSNYFAKEGKSEMYAEKLREIN